MFGRVPDEGLHGSCLRFPLDSKWIYSGFDLSTKRFKISCVSCAAKDPCPFHGGVANSRLQTRYAWCYSLLTAETWAFGLDTFGFQGVGAAGAAYGERGAEYVELHAASEKSPCAHRDAANDRTARCRVVEQTEDEKHEQVGCDVPRCAVVSMKHQEVLALIQIWCWLCVKLPY